MPRPPSSPVTALGMALHNQRNTTSLDVLSKQLGISQPTLSRLERGTHRPSYDTAKALASWLGWTVEQVMDAAEKKMEGLTQENS